MTTSSAFCQDSTQTRPVKITTLKAIMRQVDKCDSLQVAFDNHMVLFNDLVKQNLNHVAAFEKERQEKQDTQALLDTQTKQLNKFMQKPNAGWILPAAVGFVGGIIVAAQL